MEDGTIVRYRGLGSFSTGCFGNRCQPCPAQKEFGPGINIGFSHAGSDEGSSPMSPTVRTSRWEGVQQAYWVALPCYALILYYSWHGHRVGRPAA